MALFSLAEMLGRSCPTLHIADVGAMWLGAEEMPYRALAKLGVARVIGFEAVQAECDKLNALGLKHHTFLPHAVGDGSARTLHITNASMTSSLYEPNTALLSRFNNLEEVTRVVRTEPVQTRRLDDLAEIDRLDFLKMDVQGAELDVLRGAERILKGALVVQTEVEFVEMYKGQPLFADVDRFLRERGFALHFLYELSGRAFKPVVANGDINQKIRQGMWTDAVYVRDFMRFGELSAEQLLKLAVLVHELFGSVDLAALALQHHDAKTDKKLWPAYMTRLTGRVPEAPAL